MKLAAVILAAGYSTRMDGFKPLLRLGGKSLIGRGVNLFLSSGIEKIVVVTGHRHKETIAEAKQFGADVVYNPDFDRGMFSSVCAAVSLLEEVDGFFLLPVDIPLVRPVTIKSLVSAFDKKSVVYPCRNGMRGHPPLIPANLISQITQSDGKGGLRPILARNSWVEINVWDDGPFFDADTPDDFNVLAQKIMNLESGSKPEAEAIASLYMPPKGIDHGRAVAKVGCCLAAELNANGYDINVNTVHNSCLLHDIGKGNPSHEKFGANMLAEFGLHELVESVASHRDIEPTSLSDLREKELVCLADKLIKGKQLVSIRQRFEEKLTLFKDDPEECGAIQRRFENAQKLQRVVETAASRGLNEILDSCNR